MVAGTVERFQDYRQQANGERAEIKADLDKIEGKLDAIITKINE